MSLSVGIIGSGIGGLTTALACRQAGFDVEVFEARTCVLAPAAIGLQLSPNATKVLRALRVLDGIAVSAVSPPATHVRTLKSGYLIGSLPLGQMSESRYSAPTLLVQSTHVEATLADALRARHVHLHLNTSVTTIRESDRGVTLVTAHGESRRFDIVVGCDGRQSTLRQVLFGRDDGCYTGQHLWHAQLPTSRGGGAVVTSAITLWLGPHRHCLHYTVADGDIIDLIGVIESERAVPASWQIGDPQEFAAAFADGCQQLTQLIAAADTCRYAGLYTYGPLQTWSHGRITLLGDAAHPTLPFLAQGAALAIEDAWVLARLLEDWEDDDPVAGLREYEHYRLPRAARVQRAALAEGRLRNEARPFAALARNLKLGISTRLLPEVAMEQLDWLHGYDAVKGFD